MLLLIKMITVVEMLLLWLSHLLSLSLLPLLFLPLLFFAVAFSAVAFAFVAIVAAAVAFLTVVTVIQKQQIGLSPGV